jgi:hypothetical protein
MRIVEVLAVPGPPTRSVFLWPGSDLLSLLITGRLAILSIMYSALVESDVGISSCENWILFGGTHSSASHIFHPFELIS